ncbi:hypothetical protein BV61_01270 [Candidatus Synechococcus spongiarum LMB bulk15M]|uniref:Uncharacterized protein n=1 Tax=Candidatus Synechococcus spongiarum LMB bulk15M TaxID=1943582 RepID=A0A1T1D2R2_9SYNE|nr:hypothetical protein BV61_01270 [Candidatus Synechococcus spongiarum LMB bulk15M]
MGFLCDSGNTTDPAACCYQLRSLVHPLTVLMNPLGAYMGGAGLLPVEGADQQTRTFRCLHSLDTC